MSHWSGVAAIDALRFASTLALCQAMIRQPYLLTAHHARILASHEPEQSTALFCKSLASTNLQV